MVVLFPEPPCRSWRSVRRRAAQASQRKARPTFWGARLSAGKKLTVTVPKGSELRITSVCGSSDAAACVSITPLQAASPKAGRTAFRLRSSACTKGSSAALVGDIQETWSLAVDGQAPMEVDLVGYFWQVPKEDDDDSSDEVETPAKPSTSKSATPSGQSSGSSAQAAIEKEATPPPKPVAAYNPLRPAAAGLKLAHASMTQAGKKATTVTEKGGAPVWTGPLRSLPSVGLKFEENVVGKDGAAAELGDKVDFKFSIINADTKKTLERGEIQCRLGGRDVLDGWVDGTCDMEEVLGRWGRSLQGMRQGGRRRVHVPAGKGFKENGGEHITSQTSLIFDVQCKKVMGK